MNPRFWITPLIAFSLCGTAFAQKIETGKRPNPVSATAASGRWLERAAFKPETYGKVRGVSPVASQEEKIVLYTSALNEDFFKIAAAVDSYIADKPELAWSFVEVRDAKGAQYGGYTADELRARLSEIQELAKKHGIKHLSFLVAAPGIGNAAQDTKVSLVHLKVTEKSTRFPVVDWMTEMPAAELQGAALTKVLMSLDTAVYAKKN